jgi:NTE family protein
VKRALVCSGGGSKGSYAVGAIREYHKRLSDKWFDIVGGTSTGALIAPFTALTVYDPSYLDRLVDIYSDIEKKDVMRRRPWWKWITGKCGSFFMNDRLQDIVVKNFTPTEWGLLNRADCPEVYVSITDFSDGSVKYVSPRNTNYEGFLSAMVASASIPVVYNGIGTYYDGGVRALLPLSNAIKMGAESILGILLSSPVENWDDVDSIISTTMRTIDIFTLEGYKSDIEMASLINNVVKLKYSLEEFAGSLNNEQVGELHDIIDSNPLYSENNYKLIDIDILQGQGLGDGLVFNSIEMRKWMQMGSEQMEELLRRKHGNSI